MQFPFAIFAFNITAHSIFIIHKSGNNQVKVLNDLFAAFFGEMRWNDKKEVISTYMSYKTIYMHFARNISNNASGHSECFVPSGKSIAVIESLKIIQVQVTQSRFLFLLDCLLNSSHDSVVAWQAC